MKKGVFALGFVCLCSAVHISPLGVGSEKIGNSSDCSHSRHSPQSTEQIDPQLAHFCSTMASQGIAILLFGTIQRNVKVPLGGGLASVGGWRFTNLPVTRLYGTSTRNLPSLHTLYFAIVSLTDFLEPLFDTLKFQKNCNNAKMRNT
jgi:hypothetical protein